MASHLADTANSAAELAPLLGAASAGRKAYRIYQRRLTAAATRATPA
ncbi:hypothetical protein [Amycolatopsis sp. WAC 01416]|nr:hypothetical protein [Amycolatopsis sp. WAC 01416]